MGTGGRGAFEGWLEITTDTISGRGGIEDGLRKGKPEFNSDARFHDAGVNRSSRIDNGPKHKIREKSSEI